MHRRPVALLALILLGVSACSSIGRPLPPPSEVAELMHGIPERPDYRLHVGDRLAIRFTYQPEQNRELPIRPDGRIRLAMAGEIVAEGLTPTELADAIEERVASRLRDPEVFVVVMGFGDRRVYVGGEVKRPGFIGVQDGMTPLQAVFAAGGFEEGAARDSVLYVLGTRSGGYAATRVDLDDVITNGTPETVRIAGNDIVWVPRSRIGNANEFVQLYIRNMMPIETRAGFTYPIFP